MMLCLRIGMLFLLTLSSSCEGFVPIHQRPKSIIAMIGERDAILSLSAAAASEDQESDVMIATSRRTFLNTAAITSLTTTGFLISTRPTPADAIGPVKLTLVPTSYSAVICPPNKPIPGQKAMVGMKGLCVTVYADLKEKSPKELSKVGVYGFVTDGNSGDSVLANNPDLSTDAGQFAMIEVIKPTDDKVAFEFIAAVPYDKDLSKYDNGIGPLNFESLRIISFPGGQQFGEISPCEMNEFSDECAAWEEINGPYEKGEYMIKSNPRTKGR